MVLLWCCCGGLDGGGTAAVAFVCEDEALSRTQRARCAIECVFVILCGG